MTGYANRRLYIVPIATKNLSEGVRGDIFQKGGFDPIVLVPQSDLEPLQSPNWGSEPPKTASVAHYLRAVCDSLYLFVRTFLQGTPPLGRLPRFDFYVLEEVSWEDKKRGKSKNNEGPYKAIGLWKRTFD